MECFTSSTCVDALMRDINDQCDNMMHSGIEATGLIVNKEDIDTIARDANNRRHVTALTLKPGKRAFRIVNKRNNPFTGTSKTIEAGDFRNSWTKTVAAFIPTDGWEAGRDILDPLANNKFVVILAHEWEHTNSNGFVDNKYEIFGLENGLRVSSMTQTAYENNDVYSVEMQETGAMLSGVYMQTGEYQPSLVPGEAFKYDGGNFVNPYTGDTVAPSAFSESHPSLGVTEYYIDFGHDGKSLRWYTATDPATAVSDLSAVRVEEFVDTTCTYLSALTEEAS